MATAPPVEKDPEGVAADASSVDLEKYDRRPLKLRGVKIFALAFSTLGIIYSDIGTSPLYVLNGIWSASGDAPSKEDVIGGVSAIVWSITIIPLIKYVGFALEFGTGPGEGGPFALFMTLFPTREPRDDGRSLTTYPTNIFSLHGTGDRRDKLTRFKWPLFIWTIFGTSLTLADGVLTPAVSVTSAVGGIAVAKPNITHSVVPVSIAFLLALFFIQRWGTSKLSIAFAPITAIWLLLLGGTGIYNIVQFPGIWRAWDPSRAILWFVRTKDYDNLAGVLLAITGCEAMFANLGQFNKASIRIGFSLLVYPMLILAYLGQGARLITDPSVISSIFYLTIPGKTGGGLYWIVFVFAILATLIASQAMITATFSLVHQLIGMDAFPSLRIKHTSTLTAGQVYIGPVNWLLMIGTIAVVGGFGSSAALTLAYGFAVATVLFVTTTLISLSIPFVKGLPYFLGIVFLLTFGFFDGLFWGASLKKVPHGAWFPLGLGGLLCVLMSFWHWGRTLEDKFDQNNTQRLGQVISSDLEEEEGDDDGDGPVAATSSSSSSDKVHKVYVERGHGNVTELGRIPVIALFYRNDSAGRGVPHGFASFVRRYPALPQVVIFLSTRVVGVPHVPLEDRYVVTKVRSFDGFFTVTMRAGYLDHAVPSILELVPYLQRLLTGHPEQAAQLAQLADAGQVTHVVPSYSIFSQHRPSKWWDWVRRLLVEDLYARARVVFPDWSSAPNAAVADVLHVAVAASI